MKKFLHATFYLALSLILAYGVYRMDQRIGPSFLVSFLGGACSMGFIVAVLLTVED